MKIDLSKPYPVKKPLLKFRVYPDQNRVLYFVVHIWRNKKEMFEHNVRYDRQAKRDRYEANVIGQRWEYDGKLIPRLGEINFYDGGLDAGVISHEMTHAAFDWAKRKRLNMKFALEKPIKVTNGRVDKNHHEEAFCYAQGRMVEQFYERVWRNRRQIERHHTKQRTGRKAS